VASAGSGDPSEHPWYTIVADEGEVLLAWFRASGTTAVLVRPDHVVQTRERLQATAHGPGAALAEYLRRWADDMSWRPSSERANLANSGGRA
jgi:hypothetical protein